MKCSIRALILLCVVVAAVQCYGPPRPRPMRRSPPPRHMIVSRRDPAYVPGPPYSKRPMSNMMISRPGSRPKKHVSGAISGHYSKYSPIYKYPPPPHSRPYSVGPPKKSFYSRPYGPPSKYPYYGKHPGYPAKKPQIPYEPDIPKETIATFVNTPSNYGQGTPVLSYKKGNKVPTITYGSPSIASKPYNLYGSSEEDTGSVGSSEEFGQGSHHVSASIKYGKNTPGNSPAHPSLLDPATNIKYPGPTFKFPAQSADSSNKYQTINPTQATRYNSETSQVKYPSSEGSQSSSTYRRRRPQRQDASKATQAVTSKPYTTSNVKFPEAGSDGSAASYQNYDHFLQETFAPDLGGGAAAHQADTSAATKQKKRDRTKSRYRAPASHYEVRDEPEERGDTYDDIETVDSDYEGWQPSDTK